MFPQVAMLDGDLRHRTSRFMAGDRRVTDLDRLFLGLRARAGTQSCFREIGDFVAHRDVRKKGMVTQVGRDVFTSVDVWSLKLRDREPSWSDIARAAWANFRLASDEQLLAGCGCQRSAAKQRLSRALTKIEMQGRLTEKEMRALSYLGNRFIWRPAFSAAQLATEFMDMLVRARVVAHDVGPLSTAARTFMALYALALMHGSAIILDNGERARLLAGFANRECRLEVKVELVFTD